MYKNVIIFLLILASMISTANATDKENKNRNTEQKQVLSVINKMTAAFHDGNLTGVMASYEKNATIVFELGKPVSDLAIVKKMFQGFFSLNPKFSYSGHEVFISGDIALHFAPWTMKGKTPDGNEVIQSGLSVAVLRRQVDGKWLMVIDNPHGQKLLSR